MRLACLVLLVLATSVWAKKADVPDYRSEGHGVELPRTAEKVLLERLKAKKIVSLRSMVLERNGDDVYLGVWAAYEVDWSFEGVWHPLPYVLKKQANKKDWTKARLYRLKDGDLRQLFAKPARDWATALEEVKPAK
jgi:hypothetical protein